LTGARDDNPGAAWALLTGETNESSGPKTFVVRRSRWV
jgi:hypothetical protein